MLPRGEVTDFLEELNPELSARYIEYLIQEMKETSEPAHERLAELYFHAAEDEHATEGEHILD